MRKVLNAVIFIPLALILLAFAVANRQVVTISFDPFSASDPAIGLSLPLFAVIIVIAILGVLAGGFATWWRQGVHRRRARQLAAETGKLRAEIDSLRAAARGEAPPADPTYPLILPPAA